MATETSTDQRMAIEPLPEHWPADAKPETVRAWWIPWPVAVLLAPLLWILPRRMGPHFATVRWPGAIVAHLLWVFYAIGSMIIAFERPRFGWVAWVLGRVPGQEAGSLWPAPTLSEMFRSPPAMVATAIAREVDEAETLLIGFAALLGFELVFVLLGVLLMPFTAGVGRVRSSIGRSIKLTFWATTSLIVLGLAFEWIAQDDMNPGNVDDNHLVLGALYMAWFLWIWLRSAMRLPEPPEVKASEPRPPRCETCGYRLTGLTADDQCPECGAAARDSLPTNRRPSPFAEARSIRARVPAFFKTLRCVLIRRDFFKHLVSHQHYESARRFAIVACVFSALAGLAVFAAVTVILFSSSQEAIRIVHEPWATLLNPYLAAPLLCSVLLLIPGSLAVITAIVSRRTARDAAVLAFHFTAWSLPLTISIAVAGALLIWMGAVHGRWLDGVSHLGPLGRIPRLSLYILPVLLPLLVVIQMAARLSRACTDTRFANA